MRHIIPISGKDSLCTAIVQMAREPNLPYEFLFLDVETELPETYDWLTLVESKLGISIIRVGESLEAIIEDQGILPSHQRRFCTKYAKIYPLQNFVKGTPAIQYLGIRSDEVGRVTASSSPLWTNSYPLVDMGIDLPRVYEILTERGLLPPMFFWKRLFEDVYNRVNVYSQRFIDKLKPWEMSHFFSWRSRSNCFMCFYQRLYEWVGLLEHHPDLYQRSLEMENQCSTQNSNRLKQYTLNSNWSLVEIKQRKGIIFNKRSDVLSKQIVTARHSSHKLGGVDLLATVGCGMYCGK